MQVKRGQLGTYAFVAALSVLAVLILLTVLGWMPDSHDSGTDRRYEPLTAPEKLGGYPRWHGMVDGELRDAAQVTRQYRAAAVEASYLPPGLDPVLVTAVRAHDSEVAVDGTTYGAVTCSSSGVFLECVRTGQSLTVNVLAPKEMAAPDVVELVNEFWHAVSAPPVPSTPATSVDSGS